MSDTELITSKELAAWRRCSIRKLDRERAEGRGPKYVRIDSRVFYRRGDVVRFIADHLCGGDRSTEPPDASPPPRVRRGPRKCQQRVGGHLG